MKSLEDESGLTILMFVFRLQRMSLTTALLFVNIHKENTNFGLLFTFPVCNKYDPFEKSGCLFANALQVGMPET